MDCMEGMKEFPDKFFDLAIVDPPYGGGAKAEHASPENLTGGGRTGKGIKRAVSAADSGSITSATDRRMNRRRTRRKAQQKGKQAVYRQHLSGRNEPDADGGRGNITQAGSLTGRT